MIKKGSGAAVVDRMRQPPRFLGGRLYAGCFEDVRRVGLKK